MVRPPGLILTAVLACSLFASAVVSQMAHAAEGGEERAEKTTAWQPPEGFPYPPTPEDNPITREKIELGRLLFFDQSLSRQQNTSCSSCHSPQHSYADAGHPSVGAGGDSLPRNSLPLINLAWRARFGWADSRVTSLEQQMQQPMFNQHPAELDFVNDTNLLKQRLLAKNYLPLFQAAFPEEPEHLRADLVIKAIATFERTLTAANSVFDHWLFHGQQPDQAVRAGFELFQSKALGCSGCHSGINFNGDFNLAPGQATGSWHNTGVSAADPGLYDVTGRAADKGRFKTPTLRNLSCTAPYMHDGSIDTLEGVITHYRRGPNPNEGLKGFDITTSEQKNLIAFLRALTSWEDTNQGTAGCTSLAQPIGQPHSGE